MVDRAALSPNIAALARKSSMSDEEWEGMENDPGFQCMMEEAERQIREGRGAPQEEVFANARRGIERTEQEEHEFERRYIEYWHARTRPRHAMRVIWLDDARAVFDDLREREKLAIRKKCPAP